MAALRVQDFGTLPLITSPHSRGAVIGAAEAQAAGLPATELNPTCEQWRRIWDLWTHYFASSIYQLRAYEGAKASQIYQYDD
ncbi:hypothetical protein BN971_01305 [Mycobacterium bohemicum DSM 44277]|uniref:Uncharacterized protein n=1 Tax=Mycobacterium bohemicum DSM 44277 TaxID=1236609 RepID=A0A0U0W5F6_MYCBE|nr:hypothetical protein [Mycobacterium bohemicum]CPR08576.1 hypothetical protein BN971_01305 [Mycobacterium bohemicum DSM 44277]